MEIQTLAPEDLEQIRLERMISLDDTQRITANMEDMTIKDLPTPAEIIATGIEQFANGGFDEITQTPYVAAGIDRAVTSEHTVQPV